MREEGDLYKGGGEEEEETFLGLSRDSPNVHKPKVH